MSIVGFTGLAAFEIVWGARILKVLFNGNVSVYYLAIFILAGYLVLYLVLGGQRGTINTGQYQLVVAYVGVHAIVAWAVLQTGVSSSSLDAPFLIPTILVIGGIMLWSRIRLLLSGRGENPDGVKLSKKAKIIALIIVTSLSVMMVALLCTKDLFSRQSLGWKPIDMSSPEFGWQLAAFAILPIFFQFVDMTTWQRIAALAKPSSGASWLKLIRDGLRQYLIESPLSWLFPVLLGLCAARFLVPAAGTDPWDAFVARIFAEPGITGALLSIAIVSGVASIFLSTADGLLSAIGYSFAYDLHPRSRRMIDVRKSEQWNPNDVEYVVARGQGAMGVFLGIVVLIFVAADAHSSKGETLLGLFLAFLAPMASFAPAIIIPALTRRAAHRYVAWASIACGAAVGIICGIISVFKGGLWQWLSIDLSIATAWSIYIFGFPFGYSKLTDLK